MNEFVDQLKEKADRAFRIAREQLQTAAKRRKTGYDIRVRRQSFEVGDWVWYYYPRRFRGRSPKWQCNYIGPYRVVRVIEPSNYAIQKSSRAAPFVVHADKLKKCYSDVDDLNSKFGAAPTVQRSSVQTVRPEPTVPITADLPDRPVRDHRRPAYLNAYV